MFTTMKKIGRNDPCPCKSGNKYKQCCYAQDRARGPGRPTEAGSVDVLLEQAMHFQQAGRLLQAAASYRQALALKPDLAGAHYNLGNVLQEQGELDEAVASYRRALEIQPDSGEAYCNLGSALKDQGKLEEAIAVYRSALAFRSDYVLVHFNLGNALRDQGKLEEAAACYRRAIALKPDFDDAHNNLAATLRRLGRLEEQAASLRERIALFPERSQLHALLADTLAEQGKTAEALASHRKALSLNPGGADVYDDFLFLSAYHALLEPQAYLALARGWEQAVVPAPERESARQRRFQRPPPGGRRLKVGYVSWDFRQHAVSYFVEQLFGHHDRAQFEVFAYHTNRQRDEVTGRIEAQVEHWAPVAGLSDGALRDRIEADGIDVLVDLSGHTAGNRLGVFARRAAPVQAHYLGYFASTGLTEMDYWIGDDIVTPAGDDSVFSEKIWRLPRTWVSYDGKADAPQPKGRPEDHGAVTIGSFTDLKKIKPESLALWSKILRGVPKSRLLLKNRQLADAANRRRVEESMAAHGVPADRVELKGSEVTPGWHDHMAYHDRLDIALDPVDVMTGSTTTCDALWMGLPVVTLMGDRMGSRMAASKLTGLGHPEWIAHSAEDYVRKVVALAASAEQRRQLRLSLRSEMARSALCDARGLARTLEDAYMGMSEQRRQRTASLQ